MRFHKKRRELSWEQIVTLHQQGGDASRACLDVFRSIFLDETNADAKAFLFTSAAAAEGKTTMALHFAAMLATKGKRVLLVDAHWRRPSLGRSFGVAERPGLGDVIETGEGHPAPVQDSRLPQLFVLPAGTRNADLLDGAARERLGAFLQRQRSEFDFVLLDAAPTASGPDVLLLNPTVDGVLLVVACDRTQRAQVAAARSAIEARAGKLVGVILNRVPSYLPAYYRTL
jgi:capsular exopolysaccharide synthesis family protein